MALSPSRGPFYLTSRFYKHTRRSFGASNRCPNQYPLHRLHHSGPPPNDFPRRTPKITSISPSVTPTRRGPLDRLHMPGSGWAQHELYLNFRSREPPCTTWYTDGRAVTEPPCPPPNPYFLSSIRTAVARYPDIDAVHLHTFPTKYNKYTKEVWQALFGLEPSHLEMTPGFEESCDYAGLANVTPPWPLKSLYLAAYGGDGASEHEDTPNPQYSVSFPACYADLETLVLHFPNGHDMYFYPEGGARKLRSFTASQNDVVDAFAKTVACNPALLHTLRSVTLDTGPGGRDSRARHVGRVLEFFRQSSLERLELLLNDGHSYMSDSLSEDEGSSANDSEPEQQVEGARADAEAEVDVPKEDPDVEDRWRCKQPYLNLSNNLPSSLTSLSFRAPANVSMLEDLEKWIACANDPTWLPNLQAVAFRLDLKNNLGSREELSREQEEVLGKKVERLLGILAGRTPSVQIAEPRDHEELVYPLLI
ncbi:hypothetical protein FA13DRAFT_1737942 [Coprinellus micaceus]|uniref:Uncharacterized protein n=1 Tax=Coprinellus micaceus TaxID=71717 RepID=A0A4Y7SVR3_COPMI|nr:hypothetical protein FA13DRAFT_1737942 [Coprinellus micaceus]